MSTTETFVVSGMTCDHCASSVSAEVGNLAGVTAVEVDLSAGEIHVTAEQPLSAQAVQDAIEGAGYCMAG